MAMQAPLPNTVRQRIGKNTHPGLALDKYARSWGEPEKKDAGLQEAVQKPTIEQAVRLSQSIIPGLEFDELLERRKDYLDRLSARTWSCVTTSPLALHLARASALENAGICLHPLYGFAYLAGSGLKGMARAYAETVGHVEQDDVRAVFGNEPGESDQKAQHVGAIVFHDAWPMSWPKLIVDITNSHHTRYYQGEDAPGDWEGPIPVYFLAVDPGTEFSFALSKRGKDVPDTLFALAREWLVGALCHLGAGAKTNAGYSAFRLADGESPKLESPARKTWKTTLELVTPAFLAGAGQEAEDCDLRPATLRGLLRWWWRTLHAAHVDVATLRALEAAVWGDTNTGGAVRIEVETDPNNPAAMPAPFKRIGCSRKGSEILELEESFARAHGIGPAPARTTLPLFYASYGMDEFSTERGQAKERKRRFCVESPAKWQVRFVARKGYYRRPGAKENERPLEVDADSILEQAQAALWLLCQFGGVGSKGRKGFGSLADAILDGADRQWCQEQARSFRETCKLPPQSQAQPESPALERMLDPVEVKTQWTDPWFALNQVGDAMQAFAQADEKTRHGKHSEAKMALGLPRQIHGPRREPLPHQSSHSQPTSLKGPKGDRHASPVHYHLARNPDGTFTVRVVAFPSKFLPDWEKSKELLGKLMAHLRTDLARRAGFQPSSVLTQRAPHQRAPGRPGAPQPREPARTAQGLQGGDRIEVTLERHTDGKRWIVRHAASGLSGAVENYSKVPADQQPGTVTVIVKSVSARNELIVLWPTSEVEERYKPKPPGKRRSDRRPRPRRG